MKMVIISVVFTVGLVMTACHDDEPLDAKYIKGKWEVEKYDHPEYTTIYDFSTIKEFDNWGTVDVYYLATDGQTETEIPVKTYDWHAGGPQNNNGILDISIVPVDATDDELLDKWEYYVITEISSKRMTWRRETPDDGLIIHFIRRDDL